MTSQRIRFRLERLQHLSSPPEALARIFDLAADPESRLPQLAEAVESDPVLAARLLRLANSAYFGYPREIASVEHALVVLGIRTVRNLVTAVALAPVFAGGAEGLDRPQLWLHSCAVGEAARLLAEQRGEDAAVPYLAGLIHDLGQVALAEAVPDAYAEVVAHEAAQACGALEAERKVLGVDHAWAGGVLLARWQLPERLVDAVRLHHETTGAPGALADTVHLADVLAGQEGFPAPGRRAAAPALPVPVLARLGLSEADAEALREAFRERHDAVEALYASSRVSGA